MDIRELISNKRRVKCLYEKQKIYLSMPIDDALKTAHETEAEILLAQMSDIDKRLLELSERIKTTERLKVFMLKYVVCESNYIVAQKLCVSERQMQRLAKNALDDISKSPD